MNAIYFCLILVIYAMIMIGFAIFLVAACDYDLSSQNSKILGTIDIWH